jgi:hypothetical protein
MKITALIGHGLGLRTSLPSERLHSILLRWTNQNPVALRLNENGLHGMMTMPYDNL